MNRPGFQRVTLIPMETTFFSSENSRTEKQQFWKKGLTVEIKLRPLVQGQNPLSWKPRTPGHDILPVLHNRSNEWASNLCFIDKFEDIHFMINSSVHEFLNHAAAIFVMFYVCNSIDEYWFSLYKKRARLFSLPASVWIHWFQWEQNKMAVPW